MTYLLRTKIVVGDPAAVFGTIYVRDDSEDGSFSVKLGHYTVTSNVGDVLEVTPPEVTFTKYPVYAPKISSSTAIFPLAASIVIQVPDT